jgi:predicted phage terminase large subunit-like protein
MALSAAASGILLKPEAARRELARRKLARRHLVDFSEYVAPWYRAARHHRLVAEYLELVETYIRSEGRTGIGRLLIEEPPRHGKTEQVSHLFPAWLLGRMPDINIILTSYNADRANDNSRAVREIVNSDRYRAVFGELATVDVPVELSSDSRSVQQWDLAAPNRGGVVAAGVGGGITGVGAHLFVVDDPIKNREEAESEAYRERLWEWWTSSAYTRLEKGAAVIGMFTRWHGDDWSGRLMKIMASDPKADRWTVLCLEAIWEEPQIPKGKSFDKFQREQMLEGVWIDEKDPLGRRAGEALWEAKYNEEDLKRIQVNIGEYDWSALYQQRPYLRLGGFFQRDWFAIVEAPPKAEEIRQRVRYWDKAGTTGGDFTAGVLMSVTHDDIYTVEHVARGQWSPGERDAVMLKTAREDAKRPGAATMIWQFKDPGSAGLDSAQATNRMFAKKGFAAYFETVTGSKEVRSGPWSSMCQGGGVRLVRGGWNAAYIEEHVAFPRGKFDDQVDASDGAFGKLVSGTLEGQLFF